MAKKLISLSLAAATALSPISAYGLSFDQEPVTSQEEMAQEELPEENTQFLFINLPTDGGEIVINEDELDFKTVKLEEIDGRELINVYDSTDLLIASDPAEDIDYTYIFETDKDELINITAKAEDGYELTTYEVLDAYDIPEDVGFESGSEFKFPIFMSEDKTIKVEFTELPDPTATPEPTEVPADVSVDDAVDMVPATEPSDLTVNEDISDDLNITEDLEIGSDDLDTTEEDLTVDMDSEVDQAAEDALDMIESSGKDDLTVGTEEIVDPSIEDLINETEEGLDSGEILDDSEEWLDEAGIEEETEEHFLEKVDGTEGLDATQFSNSRLIVIAKNEDVIIDPEHIAAHYGDTYIMKYNDPQQAMNAYMYYNLYAFAVEPDTPIQAATEIETPAADQLDSDPIGMLAIDNMSESALVTDNVIALLDTGVSSGPNIVDRVSLIDDKLEGNPHGNEMATYITEEDPNARILSIRVLDDNGQGTVSSVIAGIEYAIQSNAHIINLSMSAEATAENSVIDTYVHRAIANGILVVGAAGNNGDNALNYIPGYIDEAYIIGACNYKGLSLPTSNYGMTVDYKVPAESTSEAAARFSGYLSKNGEKFDKVNQGFLYEADYREDEVAEVTGDFVKGYYLFYTEGDIEDVKTTMTVKFPYTVNEDGDLVSQINPHPEKYDYNANGISFDVDLNRGAPHGLMVPITDECEYENGYLTVPGKYAGEDITVTIWQSTKSPLYVNVVPDQAKPQDDATGNISMASFDSDFPDGILGDFTAMGCNIITLEGDASDYKKGDRWNCTLDTLYIGNGQEVPWSGVQGASAYSSRYGFGQIMHIKSCDNKAFVNAGSPGLSGKAKGKNWLFTGCISEVNNNFAGTPVVTSAYIECIRDTNPTDRIFYLHATCRGPQGQAAQTMAITFRVTFEPSKAELTIRKKFQSANLVSESNRYGQLETNFAAFKDKACTQRVVNTGISSSSTQGQATMKLDPGIYYIKETIRIRGTVQNTYVYGPVKLSNGDKKDLSDFVPESEWKAAHLDSYGWVMNVPITFTGKLLGKVDGETNKPLAGAVFKVVYSELGSNFKPLRTWYFQTDANGALIYDDAHLAKDYESDPLFYLNNDHATRPGLPLCSLQIQEEKAPEGYFPDEKVYTLNIQEAKDKNGGYTIEMAALSNANLVIKNNTTPAEEWKVQVNLKKVTADKKGLGGAKFALFKDKECTDFITKVDDDSTFLISGSDGTSNIIVIPVDIKQETFTVYCKEFEAPEGYKLSDEVYELTFQKSEFDKLFAKDENTNGELKTFGPADGIVNEGDEGWKVRAKTKKVDINYQPLAGAVFGVYEDEKCVNEIGEITSGNDGMTNEFSKFVSSENDVITLYFREKKAPKGYQIDETIYSLTYKKEDFDKLGDPNGELKTFGPERGVINVKGWNVRVQAKKIDDQGNNLAGATFIVYKDADLHEIAGTLESGSDGMTNILTVGVSSMSSEITLYLQESAAPDGYEATDEVFSLTFEKSKYDELAASGDESGELQIFGPSNGIVNTLEPTPSPTPTPTQEPPKPSGSGVYVKKTTTAADDVIDLESYTIEGAEFSITGGGISGTMVTNSNGESNVFTLPDNHTETWVPPVYDMEGNIIRDGYWQINSVTTTYTIRETKAPQGHKLSNLTQRITVTMPRDKDRLFTVEFEDEPEFCNGSLDIEKLGVKGEPIKDVVFKVEYFDSSGPSGSPAKTWFLKTDATGHVKMDDAHLDDENESDEFYTHKGKIVIPIGGYLQITEFKAPAQYVLDDEPKGIATTKDADFKLTYSNNKAWYNELERCRVDLIKYEDDGVTPIPGVEFELKFLEETISPEAKKHPNFERLLEPGETVTRSTDEEGKVFFDNLDQGKYQITEVKTQPGRALLKEPIIFTLPFTMSSDEAAEYGNVDFSTAKEDIGYTDQWFFYNCTYEVTNNAVFTVPTTGGSGMWKFGFVGVGLAALGTSWVVYDNKIRKVRKRKRKISKI